MSKIGALILSLCAASPIIAQSNATGGKATSQKTVWPDEGPRTWTPRPTVPAITANDLRTRLYQFADDSMHGPPNRRARATTKAPPTSRAEFKRLGLKPAGDNGTFFQDMPYGPIGFDSAASRLIAGGTPLTAKTRLDSARARGDEWAGNARISRTCRRCSPADGATRRALDPALFRGKVAVFAGAPAGGCSGRRRAGATHRCRGAIRCPTSSARRQRHQGRSRAARR